MALYHIVNKTKLAVLEEELATVELNKEQQEFCETHNLTKAQFLGKVWINGDLNLNGQTSIPKGFNPAIKGKIWLSWGRNSGTFSIETP